MRIFFIDPQSYNNLQRYDYNILSNISQEMDFFGSQYYDYLPLPEYINSHLWFKYNKKSNALLKAVSYVWTCLRIFFFMLKNKPDVIHVQWMRIPSFDYWYYKLCKCLFGFRLVFTAHNILPHNTGDKYIGPYRKFYQLADDIIVHTNNTKSEIHQKFGIDENKINVIPHGLLPMVINKQVYEKELESFNDRYYLTGKFVFASLGEQSPYKGIDILKEVWATTPQLNENPHCCLIIAGKVKLLDLSPLENFSNVIIENRRIPEEEFYYLMHHTDVYLLPYRQISQSGALLSAIAEHIPVLVTNVGGLSDPLNVANVGWRIEKCDVELLRNKMLELINFPHLVEAVKNDKEAWKRLEKEYEWKEIAKRTVNLYKKDLN